MFNENLSAEEIKSVSNALDIVMDMAIAVETDSCRKTKMRIAKQCKKINTKLADIAGKYSDFENAEITEVKANDMLEYLLLVEIGIDNYVEMEN